MPGSAATEANAGPALTIYNENFASDLVKTLDPKRLETWLEWEAVSRAADGE